MIPKDSRTLVIGSESAADGAKRVLEDLSALARQDSPITEQNVNYALSLAVDARGDLWPCSSLAGCAAFHLGNLRDGLPGQTRCLPALEAPLDCLRCGRFALCGGGCPAGRLEGRAAPLACVMQEVISEIMTGEESQ